jgi:hypothetical protein
MGDDIGIFKGTIAPDVIPMIMRVDDDKGLF